MRWRRALSKALDCEAGFCFRERWHSWRGENLGLTRSGIDPDFVDGACKLQPPDGGAII